MPSGAYPKPKKTMNPRQARFVAEYAKDANASRAALAAGYVTKSPHSRGKDTLRNPLVQEAMKQVRETLVKDGIYNLAKAMKEAEEAIDFSKQTGNANAYVKAVELRSKLNGLMVEKHDVRQSGFVLNIGGLDLPSTPSLPDITGEIIMKSIEDKRVEEQEEEENDDIFG